MHITTRRKAVREAISLGCSVKTDGGDLVVTHPKVADTQRINNRRKDVTRSFIIFLKKAKEANGG